MEPLWSGRAGSVELSSVVREGDRKGLSAYLARRESVDVVREVSRLSDADRVALLELLQPDDAASVAERIPDVQVAEALEHLDPGVAAAILEELPDPQRAELLADVDDATADSILEEMEPEAAEAARTIGAFPRDVAGARMSIDYLCYPETATVGDVRDDLKRHFDAYRRLEVQYLFVVSANGTLVGVLSIRDLLFTQHTVEIGSIMNRSPVSVRDYTPIDDVHAFFEQHDLFGAPVVDGTGRLIGLIRRSEIADALVQRTESSFLRSRGIVGGDELRSMPVLRRARRRLSWLSANIALNLIAASVLVFYEDVLASAIALAVFLPIISDMSGCSGNQAVAVSLREMSLGLLRPSDVRPTWLREISVGAINGLVLGTLLAVLAWVWKGNAVLGLVVGLALALNTVIAVSIGGTVPLFLRAVGKDPAVAAGPILTTITDLAGFFLLLTMAAAVLPSLG